MASTPVKTLPLLGVNLLDDPRAIDDRELCYAQNTFPVRPGVLSKRLGMKNVEPLPVTAFPKVTQVLACCSPPFESGIKIIWASRGYDPVSNLLQNTTIYWSAPGKDALGTLLDLGCVTRGRPTFVPYNNRVYVFPGYPFNIAGKYFNVDAIGNVRLDTFEFAGTNNSDLVPNVAGIYKERFVFGDFGPGKESAIVMADIADPATIGNNAYTDRRIEVGSSNGDRLVAFKEITQGDVGNPTSAALLVLKEYSAHIITGEPLLTTESGKVWGDANISRINYDCGCASAETVCTTPYGTIWAGHDDVWFFAKGSLPIRIGSKIRPRLLGSPAGGRYLWHAAYFDGIYRLACYSPGRGPADITGFLSDPEDTSLPDEQWWLDLRGGPPQSHKDAQWWGPQIFKRRYLYYSANSIANNAPMVVDKRPGQDPALLAVEVCDSTYQLVQYDKNTERDLAHPTNYGEDDASINRGVAFPLGFLARFGYGNTWEVTTAGGATAGVAPAALADVASKIGDTVVDGAVTWTLRAFGWSPGWVEGTEIEMDILGKEMDAGDEMVDKIYDGTEIELWTSRTQRLSADVILDGGKETKTSAEDVVQTGFRIGVSQLDQKIISRRFQSFLLDPNPGGRTTGAIIQHRLYDTAGYVLLATEMQLTFRYNGVDYDLTFTDGYYADLKAVFDHIIARMNTVAAGGFSHSVDYSTAPSYRPIITHSTNQWLPLIATDDAKQFWGLLGFSQASFSLALAQKAEVTPFRKDVADWEIAGLNHRLLLINRRPT